MATYIDSDGQRKELTAEQASELLATRAARAAQPKPKPKPNMDNIIALLISKGIINQSDIDSL